MFRCVKSCHFTRHMCQHKLYCVHFWNCHVDLHMCPSSLHLFPTGSLSWPPHSHQSSTHFYPGQPPFEGWVINVPSDTPSGHRGSLGEGGGLQTRTHSHRHTYISYTRRQPCMRTCKPTGNQSHSVNWPSVTVSCVLCMTVTPGFAQRDHFVQ